MYFYLWMVSKIKASAARPGLSMVSFCTGFHSRNGARERSEE